MEQDETRSSSLENGPLSHAHHLNDTEGKLYAAFRLGKGSLLQLIGPQVLWRGLKTFLTGTRPGKMGKDVRQMSGAFVVSHGTIQSAHRSKNASDLPDLEAMAEESQRHAS